MPLSDYEIVIGLEVHTQLRTRTKMFCGCKNEFDAPPNTNVCPVCMGMPGALPTVNGRAVEFAIRTGFALGCQIRSQTKFDRKNYFYPDLPKGYQITQFDQPIAFEGVLQLYDEDGNPLTKAGIERAHMEEDTGKTFHDDKTGRSYLDYNRCGVPLLEIVGKPDLRSADEAHAYVTTLRKILQYAGISNADMQKGEMRVDANISLRPKGQAEYGVKAEVKNMNSIAAVRNALKFEAWRQAAILDAGGTVQQETRGWRETKVADRSSLPTLAELSPDAGVDGAEASDWPDEIVALGGFTVSQRSKEFANDYRYFPEPDLPPIMLDAAGIEAIRSSSYQNPYERFRRFQEELELTEYQARTLVLDGSKALADFFEEVVHTGVKPDTAAKVILNQVSSTLNERIIGIEDYPLTVHQIGTLAKLVEEGVLPSQNLKKLYAAVLEAEPESDPRAIGEKQQLLTQEADSDELRTEVKKAIDANPDAVEDVRAGKDKAKNKIMGSVMKATNRRFRPDQIMALIDEELGAA